MNRAWKIRKTGLIEGPKEEEECEKNEVAGEKEGKKKVMISRRIKRIS